MASDVCIAPIHLLKAHIGYALLCRGVQNDSVTSALGVIDTWSQASNSIFQSPSQAAPPHSSTQPQPEDEKSASMEPQPGDEESLHTGWKSSQFAEEAFARHDSRSCQDSLTCRRLRKRGTCIFGDNCWFSHAGMGSTRKVIFLSELLPPPSQPAASNAESISAATGACGVGRGCPGDGLDAVAELSNVIADHKLEFKAKHDELCANLVATDCRINEWITKNAGEVWNSGVDKAMHNIIPLIHNALTPELKAMEANWRSDRALFSELRTRVDSLSIDLKRLAMVVWDAHGQPRPLPTAGAGTLGHFCDGDADCLPLPQFDLVADSLPCGAPPRAAPCGAALLAPGAAPAPSVAEHAPLDSVQAPSPPGAAERQTHASRQITLIRAHQKLLAYADDQVVLIRAHLACSGSAVNEPRASAHCVPKQSQISTSEETSFSSGPRSHSDTVDLSCPSSWPPDANFTDAPRSFNFETACTSTGDLPWSFSSQILTSARTSASSHVESHLDTVGLVSRPLSLPPDAKSHSDTVDLSRPLSLLPDAKSHSDTVDLSRPLSLPPDAKCEAGPIQNFNPLKKACASALSTDVLNYDFVEEIDGDHLDDRCRAWLNGEFDDSDDGFDSPSHPDHFDPFSFSRASTSHHDHVDHFSRENSLEEDDDSEINADFDHSATNALHARFPKTTNFTTHYSSARPCVALPSACEASPHSL